MTIFAHVVGHSAVRIWNLSAAERIERQLASLRREYRVIDDLQMLSRDARVLLLRVDYITEPRTIRCLIEHENTVLRDPLTGAPAAAFVDASGAVAVARLLRGESADLPDGIGFIEPHQLAEYDETLRRAAPPLLEFVTAATRKAVEARLYGNAYKGITDLVTKWVWPRPARLIVRLCAQLRISPNAVTLAGLALVLLATLLFYRGEYGVGLAAAWVMTFLDTVDGKLARVMVQSSRFGHALDHGIDIVHPPIWYVAWGAALSEPMPIPDFERADLLLILIVAYFGGRLAEAAFHGLGSCTIFTWRPFDAYFRLITARRNPCLIILTLATLAGSPAGGIVGVTVWTALTTLVLCVRLLQGVIERRRHGPLQSWLHDRVHAARAHPGAFAMFAGTRGAYGPGDVPFGTP